MEWVRLHHESVTGRDGYSDFYKKDITFNSLGPVGDKVEEWTLKGAYIQSANFSDMDYAGEDLADRRNYTYLRLRNTTILIYGLSIGIAK